MKLKIVFITLGLALLFYILVCIFIYFQTPKNFEEVVKWQGSREKQGL